MLKWIFRVLLLRTLLRRFWMFAILFGVARRFLPWEQPEERAGQRRRFV